MISTDMTNVAMAACYDPSLLSEQALPGKFSFYSSEGFELMEDGGLNGGDTCSPINCGSVFVNNSSAQAWSSSWMTMLSCSSTTGTLWVGNQSVPTSQLLI